jgi:hypothetical protein
MKDAVYMKTRVRGAYIVQWMICVHSREVYIGSRGVNDRRLPVAAHVSEEK